MAHEEQTGEKNRPGSKGREDGPLFEHREAHACLDHGEGQPRGEDKPHGEDNPHGEDKPHGEASARNEAQPHGEANPLEPSRNHSASFRIENATERAAGKAKRAEGAFARRRAPHSADEIA